MWQAVLKPTIVVRLELELDLGGNVGKINMNIEWGIG